jgi:hypothetical protein
MPNDAHTSQGTSSSAVGSSTFNLLPLKEVWYWGWMMLKTEGPIWQTVNSYTFKYNQ